MTNLENNDAMTAGFTTLSPDGEEHVSSEVETVFGQDGDDTITGFLTGDEPGSTLFGNSGDDYIRSRGIGDRVFGGRGADTITNDNGRALIYGDRDSDYLLAEDSNATLFGGIFVIPGEREESAEDGNDTLVSQGGKNILVGGGGDDNLVGEEGEDTMAGGGGDDEIKSGPNGASYLFGNEGKDQLFSTSDDDPDTLFGGRGDDTLDVLGEAEGPALFGGVGGDRISINVNVNNAIIFGDVGPTGEFGGSDGEEKGADYFDIPGGEGHTLAGNAGADTFALSGSVSQTSIYGGQDDDYITGGTTGAYTGLEVFGDKGDDTISFAGSISVSNSIFSGDNADITSDFGDNVIEVRGSGNTLYGVAKDAAGSDAGNNLLRAIALDPQNPGSTSNMLVGGVGNDTIDAGSSGAGDTLDGGPDGDDKYIFTKGQTIVPDTEGINTYFGVDADQDDAVTVTARDEIGGAANFFITGDQSNVQSLGTGGIITTDSSKTQVLTVENATGTTRSGSGADRLTFTNVSGLVDAGAGDDEINISGSVSGSVSAGLGNDTINITGTDGITEGGVVQGGEGDDYLFAKAVQAGGLIDGGEGADTIAVESLFGAVEGGGLGKNVFDIDSVFGGASITTGDGDENVILNAVGSAPEGAPNEGAVIIAGGEGDNRFGVSYDSDDLTTFDGTNTARLSLSGGAGDDVLQGSPYGGDTLEAGAGADILYGGQAKILSEDLFTSTGGSELVASALSVGDGDVLVGGDGVDKFIFMGTNETGAVQSAIVNGSGLTGLGEVPGDVNVVISVGTDGVIGRNAIDENAGAQGFISTAFNVDTLNNFNVGVDRIFLNSNNTAFTTLGTELEVKVFSSSPGTDDGEAGFLFGRLTTAGGSTNFDFTERGTNIYEDDAFQFNFAVGKQGSEGLDVEAWDAVDGSTAILFDDATGGLYLSTDDDQADLIAVLPEANITEDTTLGDLITYQDLSFADLSGVNLF